LLSAPELFIVSGAKPTTKEQLGVPLSMEPKRTLSDGCGEGRLYSLRIAKGLHLTS
jgi:hypothetical protein